MAYGVLTEVYVRQNSRQLNADIRDIIEEHKKDI
jgi:hypothetical protein